MALPFSRVNEVKALQSLIDTCETYLQNIIASQNDAEVAKGDTKKVLFSKKYFY
jgi:hypothetical protein